MWFWVLLLTMVLPAIAHAGVTFGGGVTSPIEGLTTGCPLGQGVASDGAGSLQCAAVSGGGTPNILDLGDNASNESTDLVTIATDEATPTVVTLPSANKMKINTAVQWPGGVDTSLAGAIAAATSNPTNDGALVIDTDGDVTNVSSDVLVFQSGAEDFKLFPVREYPTVDGVSLVFNAANGDMSWEKQVTTSEINTEAELEGIVTNVINIFTDLDQFLPMPARGDMETLLTTSGDFGIDTTMTGLPPTMLFHDGTQVRYVLSIEAGAWPPTDGHVVSYNDAQNKLVFVAGGGGGGGTPGGSDTQVQFNNAGAFGGTTALTTDGTSMTYVGVHNAGGADSFELPNNASPLTDAAGEMALDTLIANHDPLWQYYDGTQNKSVIAVDTTALPTIDQVALIYNAATDKFEFAGVGAVTTELDGVSQSTSTATYNWTDADFDLAESPTDRFTLTIDASINRDAENKAGTTITFSDPQGKWTATDVDAALVELASLINAGFPNDATAKVSWSQLIDVPPDFADNTDDTGTGSLGSDFTSNTNDILVDAAGAAAGVMIFGATSGTQNERLSFDFEGTANEVAVSSTTGVLEIDFGTIDIRAGQFIATAGGTNVLSGKVNRLPGVTDDDCTGEQGLWWYDDTQNRFEFCETNSGSPTLLGGSATSFDQLTTGNNSTATMTVSGAALLDVTSDIRIPGMTSLPATDRSLAIDTNGNGSDLTQPVLAVNVGATAYIAPILTTYPDEGAVMTRATAGTTLVWESATGTGNYVRAGSPTLTGTVAGAAAAFTSTLSGNVGVVLHTAASAAVTAAQCRGHLHINNDADALDLTLPGAAEGLFCCFKTRFAAILTIDPADGVDIIEIDDQAGTAGNAIDSPAEKGASICLAAVDATTWTMAGRYKTWVDGGAD